MRGRVNVYICIPLVSAGAVGWGLAGSVSRQRSNRRKWIVSGLDLVFRLEAVLDKI